MCTFCVVAVDTAGRSIKIMVGVLWKFKGVMKSVLKMNELDEE